jgi:hypothetical protein
MTMKAQPTMMVWLTLSTATGCSSSPATPVDDAVAAVVGNDAVTDVPAVDRGRYPDSIGYVYQSALANIFWLQNEPRAAQFDALVESMRRGMARGVAGEILSSDMQQVDRIPDTQPSLPQMSRSAVQSVRRMAQYAFVTADYSAALSTALEVYNTNAVRQHEITDLATRLDADLRAGATPHPAEPLPAPPPPSHQRLFRPGKYLADAVRDHARAHLVRKAAQLEAAVTAGAVAAYADAFTEVFLMQRDLDLSRSAVEALAVHHVDGVLRGHPLDQVIANHVTVRPAPDRSLSVDQLSLVNQINLLANDMTAPRPALVAALLLIDEDHRQGEQDATLSCALIWQHVTDYAWLVSQLVRVKADGTTEAQINATISSIVASL